MSLQARWRLAHRCRCRPPVRSRCEPALEAPKCAHAAERQARRFGDLATPFTARFHDQLDYSIPLGGERSVNAVWTYEAPYAAVAAIKGYVAFYPDRVDAIEERREA